MPSRRQFFSSDAVRRQLARGDDVRVERAPTLALPLPAERDDGKPKADLTAGAQLVASRGAPSWTVSQTDVAREVSWLRGYVVFQKARFGEVVAEMNRYSETKLVVDDEALADVPISGAFKAGDIEAFVHAYEDYEVAQVASRSGDVVRLSAFAKE